MKLTIDGIEIEADEGQTIIEAAAAAGIEIPTLCHTPGLDPVGVCRMCVVDVGERVKAAACVRECQPGMQVTTDSEELERHRAMLTDLLMSDQPNAPAEDRREVALEDNELVALDGTVVEGRGLLHRSGAQGGTRNNRDYVALGLLLGPQIDRPHIVALAKEALEAGFH